MSDGNETVRSRDDQVSELCSDLRASLTALESKITVELLEAEARGAAEQRRKDGALTRAQHFLRDQSEAQDRLPERDDIKKWQEDQSEFFTADILEIVTEYAAWRDKKDTEGQEPIYQMKGSGTLWVTSRNKKEWEEECFQFENFNIPGFEKRILYTHPTNVAALEDRVRELEAEVTALKKPAYYAVEGDDFFQKSVADIFDSCDAEHNTILQVNGFRQVSSQWSFFDGENLNTFPTEAEAEAALTREGGV